MILILFLQFLFCHARGDGCKALEADGIEGTILVASVGEEGSCVKSHGEPPEGVQHYSSLVTAYRKPADAHEIFIFSLSTWWCRGTS
jgi:hypothetical protein